ncbi:hypothetical protein M409DRAFT_37924, partial [Zasmidium cellare ATCC 36951]
ELLTLAKVVFYNEVGLRLGDKTSLERYIRNITGIPVKALRSRLLLSFSIIERFSRTTTKLENKIYLIIGIYRVLIVPIYSEGRDTIRTRLRRTIENNLKSKVYRY